MIPQIKKLVKDNESDIILIIGVVLVALISFGAGRLTAPETNQASIIFQDPSTSSGLSPSTSSGLSPSVVESVDLEQGTDNTIYQGKFVESVNSDKYIKFSDRDLSLKS